ncbi:MAG TPA: NAD(P)-binding domain-containing protein [Candidatus Enterousia avicola]|uniref:NAD(P)-binding domain-containing protein n=1 Tax=Candidatus Enterousia avicola TaxID=2840787 RepID=A0A9D1SMX3_9PROT|nr:NAD(P)-binding domain-containing protein [Candidatus Enterousia avicola]
MKIAIIGVGTVGSAVATAVKNTGFVHEIVLFDRDGIRARAAAEDLGHAASFGFDVKISAVSNYRGIRGSDIVIVAAGANQKPGETRMDLLNKNAGVIQDIIPHVMANVDAKKVRIIILTNPLDVMVMLATKLSKLPSGKVIGTGTMLDTARLRTILSRQLDVSTQSINAYVVGEHGDSSVVDWTSATVGAVALDDFCKQMKISLPATTRNTIEHRVRNAAYEIIRGRGATWDGIGAAAADLLRCIINDEHRILTVSCVSGTASDMVAMSLPRIVGSNGVIATIKPKLSASEASALRRSGKIIRKNYDVIK